MRKHSFQHRHSYLKSNSTNVNERLLVLFAAKQVLTRLWANNMQFLHLTVIKTVIIHIYVPMFFHFSLNRSRCFLSKLVVQNDFYCWCSFTSFLCSQAIYWALRTVYLNAGYTWSKKEFVFLKNKRELQKSYNFCSQKL